METQDGETNQRWKHWMGRLINDGSIGRGDGCGMDALDAQWIVGEKTPSASIVDWSPLGMSPMLRYFARLHHAKAPVGRVTLGSLLMRFLRVLRVPFSMAP
ncbi:hypothetical protein N7530_006950 [Penicillium desertorum]|uniref:Uncharacterized protein n=1 Tax=Penicillium desertorum TaxID=1303715 RepID=A0A9W9WSN6_9EURO|nr:hypothetical protein N7530_006950 [Penicillium desertorum]